MLGDKYTKLKEKYESRRRRYPYFKSGDTITVAYREEKLDTIRQFRGVVIKLGGIGINKRFTVRKISDNAGVERIFPLESPLIDNITVNKTGKIRKAKLYYLRGLAAKKARAKKDKYISRFQSRKQ
ncbi:MAG: 50S ribosomal protein L19 [Dysgonomonas sp.]